MSVRNLRFLFRPRPIAVIGASNEPRTAGVTLMHNLLTGGYAIPIVPENRTMNR